jgi:2-oxo-4-hydroxy-4-carboxy-5-ureidoimidazoline decarboxylase
LRHPSTPITLAWLNGCSEAEFVNALGGVFEHSPWIATQAAQQRPYDDLSALHASMLDAVRRLSPEALRGYLSLHPELAGSEARGGRMTAESTREQGTLDLAAPNPEDGETWDELNRRYRAKFGFPFILCIRRHTRATALAAFRERLTRSPEQELCAALEEIALISRLRLEDQLTPGP